MLLDHGVTLRQSVLQLRALSDPDSARQEILAVLDRAGGDRSRAARILDLHPRALADLCERLGIHDRPPATPELAQLEPLMREMTTVNHATADKRASARDRAAETIRAIEARTVEALDGDALRGLDYIVSEEKGRARYRGARFRGKVTAHLDDDHYEQIPGTSEWIGREAIVIRIDGRLVYAARVVGDDDRFIRVAERPVPDRDFVAEDVASYAQRMSGILAEHIRRTREAGERYAAAERLAVALSGALATL